MSITENFSEMEEKGFTYEQAKIEADRCLLCHDPPCSKGCPANTDPGTFIRKLRLNNVTGAIRTIKQNNILGGLCGVLCPTQNLCEKECSATEIERPIRIGRLQRFLIEHSWDIGFKVFEKPDTGREKIAVIGSGPAGISCAAELAKNGYRVTVFEEKSKPGGVLSHGVPNFRFSSHFFDKELQDVLDLGVEIRTSSPINGKAGAEELLEKGFAAVFIGIGLWKPIHLREGETGIDGVFTATDYLAALREKKFDEIGKYVTGKKIAVIGGGSVAIDCAKSGLHLEAEDVYLVYRRSYNQMPAEKDEKTDALESGVHFLLLNQPVDYVTDNNRVTGLKMLRTCLEDADDSGRKKPVVIPGSEWILDVDAVIVAIGSHPADDSPAWYPSVKVNSRNLILASKETGETSRKGIFAGGDIIRGPGLIVKAVQDGKLAARAITDYLTK